MDYTGHTNARALARLFSALACGGALPGGDEAGSRVAKPETVTLMTTERAQLWGNGYGLGLVLGKGAEGGATVPGQPAGTFGHGGLGGHLSMGRASDGLGFGYTCNLQVGVDQPGKALQVSTTMHAFSNLWQCHNMYRGRCRLHFSRITL